MRVVLTSGERAALSRARAGEVPRAVILAVVCLALLVTPMAIFVAAQPARADHLLGRSTEARAEVLSVADVGRCGRRNRRTQQRVEVRYVLDGSERVGTYQRCGTGPRTGSTVPVWVGPTGWIEDSSPTYDRLGSLGTGSLFSGVALAGIGGMMLGRRRRREALLRLEREGLSPIGWATLWPDPEGRGQVQVARPTFTDTGYDAVADVVVATGPDGEEVDTGEIHLPEPRPVQVFPGRGRGVLVFLELGRTRVWAWVAPGRRSRRSGGSGLRLPRSPGLRRH